MMAHFDLPRGIRNNNPGNIRLSATRWKGQKLRQIDTAFVEFDTPVAGIRALMKLLLTYHLRYGLDSVESIINRYAPPEENATDHYIYSVCKALGVQRRDVIDVKDKKVLTALCKAIIRHENGNKDWYEQAIFDAAAMSAERGTP